MYKTITTLAMTALITASGLAQTTNAVPEQTAPTAPAVAVGEWTQDYDAAKALAKEKDLPLLLNFTGSDWCGWCILMDKQVFSTQEWKDYAKENAVLVTLDFPRDKTRVPMSYVARNQALQKKYGISGYPTYIVVASDGEKILGKLGASQTATPQKFIADFKKLVDTDETK